MLETGTILTIDRNIASISGLAGVQAEELVQFAHGVHGIALDLNPDSTGVVLLNDGARLQAGGKAHRSLRTVAVPVGQALLGRVIDATGAPLDGHAKLPALQRLPAERAAPAILERAPVSKPLATGIKVIDTLLLRRPPGREAYPGDIFYLHARLLERATCLRSGGSLTALPILETEAQNLAAYIPTNLVSITDGQIYLSPDLFHKGLLPAVDVGKSVSRVGGKAQLPAYRSFPRLCRIPGLRTCSPSGGHATGKQKYRRASCVSHQPLSPAAAKQNYRGVTRYRCRMRGLIIETKRIMAGIASHYCYRLISGLTANSRLTKESAR